MSNKRVSELAQITVGDLNSADLLLLSDVSAQESKKLTLADLNSYILTDGNLSGSFFGTASWSENSKTASYIAVVPTASFALTASFVLGGGGSSVSASYAASSSNALFSQTASFAQSVGSAQTASFATSSRFADSASFVIYTGGNNGTIFQAINAVTATTATNTTSASNAVTASFARSASNAQIAIHAASSDTSLSASTALYALTASVGISTNFQSSASYASQSLSSSFSDTAIDAQTAITASYVLPSANLQQYGIFLATTQSSFRSQLDRVDIDPFLNISATASIEVVGTMVAPYTSSIVLDESVTLYALNRGSGITYTLDSTPIYVNIQGQFSSVTASINANLVGSITGSLTTGSFTGSIAGTSASGSLTGSIRATCSGALTGSITGSISTILSGSMKFPFILMGQVYLDTGSYMFFISSSTSKIFIEPTRTSRFSVSSNIGNFGVSTGEPIQLTTTNPLDQITFSSSIAGPFTNTAASIAASASAGDIITALDISNVSGIRYVWTLTGLKSIQSNNNIFVNDVQGMPTSIVTMSLQSGNLSTLYSLSTTSASILKVQNNQLASLPTLPATMSYINCSGNPILSLPATIPFGVTDFYATNTSITAPPSAFSNTIVSMSFSNSPNLNLWLSTLPTSLSSFDASNCPQLTALPTIPANVRSLTISGDAFTDVAQDNICANLVSNGLLSGSLILLGNASLLPITLTRIATLQSRAWSVSY